jgi:uncharacterized protein YggT (Ycf19 family)
MILLVLLIMRNKLKSFYKKFKLFVMDYSYILIKINQPYLELLKRKLNLHMIDISMDTNIVDNINT